MRQRNEPTDTPGARYGEAWTPVAESKLTGPPRQLGIIHVQDLRDARRVPIAWRVRTRLVPLVASLLFRLAGVRRFLFRTVSQIGVNYRGSPLSEGVAGSVQGGDRLPRVETAPNEDNFAALTALAWQVHVYGEPPRGVAEACGDLGLPLDQFAWHPAMRRSGLVRGALYVVRPDGYVALADPNGDPERLGRYFMSRSLPVALRRDEATRFEPVPVRPGLPGVSPWGVGR